MPIDQALATQERAASIGLTIDDEQPVALMSQAPGRMVTTRDRMVDLVGEASINPAVSAEKLTALYALQKQILADFAQDAFLRALRAAQAQFPQIEKNGTIDLGADKQTGQKRGAIPFAKYEDIRRVVDPILRPLGLFFTHTERPGPNEGTLTVVSTLRHEDGHSMEAEFTLPRDNGPGRNPLQAGGSTASYCKRYNVENLLDLVRKGQDDDGKLGGTKLITEEQAEELRGMCKDAGRQEGAFLDRLFAGTVRSFEEIEAGTGYLAARNTLMGILHQQTQRQKGGG